MSENHTDDKNIELGFESDPEDEVDKFRKMERENKRALQRCATKSNKLTLEIAQLLAEVTKDYDKATSSGPPLEQEIARLRAELQKVREEKEKYEQGSELVRHWITVARMKEMGYHPPLSALSFDGPPSSATNDVVSGSSDVWQSSGPTRKEKGVPRLGAFSFEHPRSSLADVSDTESDSDALSTCSTHVQEAAPPVAAPEANFPDPWSTDGAPTDL